MAFTGTFAGDPFKDLFHVFSLFLVVLSLFLVSLSLLLVSLSLLLVSLSLLLVFCSLLLASATFSTRRLGTEYMSNSQLQFQNDTCLQPLDLLNSPLIILLLERPHKPGLYRSHGFLDPAIGLPVDLGLELVL